MSILEELRQRLRQQAAQASGGTAQASGRRPENGHGDENHVWNPGGLAAGQISEWIAAQPGSGAVELALAAARSQLPAHSRWLIVETVPELSPLALQQRGSDLNHVVFVRGQQAAENLWAVEQGLRSRAIDGVLCRLTQLAPVAFRRLKLAAEAGGSRCLLLRDPSCRQETSWADLRLLISPLPSPSWQTRHLRAETLKIRGGYPGTVVQVELNHETNAVRVVSQLGDSVDHRRATGA